MIKRILAVIFASLILLLPGCGGHHYYPPSENPSPETSSSLPSTPSRTAQLLNVRIDYIGIKNAHDHEDFLDPFNGELQLVVVVTDGKGFTEEEKIFIPLTKQGFDMRDFETKEINQRVFHTSSAGDYLKVSIVAWDIDSKDEILDALSILEALGAAGASELKTIYSLLPEEDDLIGYYEYIWYPDENWGIGQHNEVGHDDFRVWFSIYSDKEPPLVPRPCLLPDVRIRNVDVPSEVKNSSGLLLPYWYTNILTIVNRELVDVRVDWNAYSTARGEFAGGSEIIPANGSKTIARSYYYTTAGSIGLTYTISHNGHELDSWSGILNVIP